jgi:hypothetical protein
MMYKEFPFVDAPYFSIDVPDSSEVYRFQFRWNVRGGYYEMSVTTTKDEVILTGVKVALLQDAMSQYRHLTLPQVEMIPVRFKGNVTTRIVEGELESGAVIILWREL